MYTISLTTLLRLRRVSVPAAAPRSARPIATRAQAQQEVKEQYETGTLRSHSMYQINHPLTGLQRTISPTASDLIPASAAENQTGMVFKPMKEGKEQLAQVASAHLTSSSTEDSLARLNFAAESEVGINEQIK